VQTLPSTLREYVYNDINLTQSFQFMAGTNEGYNEVWWQYCSANSDVIDRYVIYNHLDNVWYYGDWVNYTGTAYQGRTAWLGQCAYVHTQWRQPTAWLAALPTHCLCTMSLV
jgi:hypothetical protein